MPFCNAFNRQHNPCLNPASRDVCDAHEFYYSNWFQEFPLSDCPTREFFFTSSSKIKAIYSKAILDSRVKITQKHFKDLESSGKSLHTLVDYYALCCMQPGVDPLWSTKLFTQLVKNIMALHSPQVYTSLTTDRSILYRFLDPIFNSQMRTFGYMLCHTLYTCVSLETALANSKHSSAANINHPYISLIQYLIEHPKFKNEFLWQHVDAEEKLLSILSSTIPTKNSIHEKIKTFVESFPSRRLEAREKKRVSFEIQKNEIEAIGWHPDRVLDWRLSLDDRQEIRDRWNC